MAFKQFISSKWFPVLLFVLLEIVFALIGQFFIYEYPNCEIGGDWGDCSRNNTALEMSIIGVIPNLIISLIIYYLIKKYYK